jgi:cyclic beta-1,2-glucan synthetase
LLGGSQEGSALFNSYGGFSADGNEYAIVLRPPIDGEPQRPPMPWINVVANESFGFLASESGAVRWM